MKWGEFISSLLRKPVLLFATATTGVNRDDCLLAVAYKFMGGDNGSGVLFYSAPASCALNGVDYHKISMHTLSTRGLQAAEFTEAVNNLFKMGTPFSYNPAFQASALTDMADCTPGYVHDLPLLMKMASARFALPAEELDKITTLPELEVMAAKMAGQPLPFKRLMRANNITIDPYTDELPVVTNVQILTRLWEILADTDLSAY